MLLCPTEHYAAGFFIRVLLLSGSRFKKQLIPCTHEILPLSLLGVIFSAGMQFLLAWYLWTRLPPSNPSTNGNNAVLQTYPGTEGNRGYYTSPNGFARVPLPALSFPNYQFANDVCRTAPIVQLVCIGLFLFSVINNIPGVLKNAAIILFSERFVSVDEEGVTKLHYWRESEYSRCPENAFLEWYSDTFLRELKQGADLEKKPKKLVGDFLRELKVFLCEMYFKGSLIQKPSKKSDPQAEDAEAAAGSKEPDEAKSFSGASRRRWMLRKFCPVTEDVVKWQANGEKSELMRLRELRVKEAKVRKVICGAKSISGYSDRSGPSSGPGLDGSVSDLDRFHVPRSLFEVNEIRSFLAEALRLIDNKHNTKVVDGSKETLVLYSAPSTWADLDMEGVDLNKERDPGYKPETEAKGPQREEARLDRGNDKQGGQNREIKAKTYESIQQVQFCDEVYLPGPTEFYHSLVTRCEYLLSTRSYYSFVDSPLSYYLIFPNFGDLSGRQVRFNLVRLDYLKPSSWLIRPWAWRVAYAKKNQEPEAGPFLSTLQTQLGKDFRDLPTAAALFPYEAKMWPLRILALLLGVLPELITLTMITVAGVPYILWSGFKVGSDTQGMEEIILATLAIAFIYDIDEMVYDHILPELYKEAHERDQFELCGHWISAETGETVERVLSGTTKFKQATQKQDKALEKRDEGEKPAGWKQAESAEVKASKQRQRRERSALKKLAKCPPLVWEALDNYCQFQQSEGGPEPGTAELQPNDSGMSPDPKLQNEMQRKVDGSLRAMVDEFNKEMAPMTAERALQMSVPDSHWNDLYLAKAYPFLYARKMRYAYSSRAHLWERFLIFYGKSGLHYFFLVAISLLIVGGYRTLARCDRFSPSGSVFGTQPWPSTCLVNVGPSASRFADLDALNATDLGTYLPMSCGYNGYVPDHAEWSKNKDYFVKG